MNSEDKLTTPSTLEYWNDDHNRNNSSPSPSPSASASASASRGAYDNDTRSISASVSAVRDSYDSDSNEDSYESGNISDYSSDDEEYQPPPKNIYVHKSNNISACFVNLFMVGVGVLVAGIYTKQCYFPNFPQY